MPRPRSDLSLTHADRARVKSCLKKAGVSANRVAVTMPGRPNLSRWLDSGSGMSKARLADLFAWCEQVEAGTWVAPIDGRKVKKVPVGAPPAINSAPGPEDSLPTDENYTEVGRFAMNRLRAQTPTPTAAEHVLETWAVQQLTYAMETLGLIMPEGYRFRVTVERGA